MYEILIRNVISLNHIAKVRRNPTDSKEFATFFSDLLRHSILFATNLYCTPHFLSQQTNLLRPA